MAAVAAVLSGYSQSIVDYVSDPRTGISGISKWLPSVAEIKEMCESKEKQIGQDEARRQRIEQQFNDRDEWEKQQSGRVTEKATAWLNRSDPIAQELSGQKAKKIAEERKFLIDDAVNAGKAISNMKLRPETLQTLIKDK